MIRPLKIFIRILNVIIPLLSISGLLLTLFIPPIGVLMCFLAVALWALLTYLQKITNPEIAYAKIIEQQVAPEIVNKINQSFNIEYNFDQNKVKESLIICQDLKKKTSRITGKHHITGTLNNVALEMTEVTFLTKKVNYSKTSAGCFTRIILLPLTIIEGFDQSRSPANYQGNEIFIYKDEHVLSRMFFAQAYFNSFDLGEFYLLPKKIELKFYSENNFLRKIALPNSLLSENYSVYATNSGLKDMVLIPVVLEFISKIQKNYHELIAVSFKNNVFEMAIPLKEELLPTNLNHENYEQQYFKTLIEFTSGFKEIVTQINSKIETL